MPAGPGETGARSTVPGAAVVDDEWFTRELYHRRNHIFSLACRLTGTRDDAEDLVQDTLLLAWKSRGQLRERNALPSWIRRICVNAFFQHARRRAARELPEEHYVHSSKDGIDRWVPTEPASSDPSPEDELIVDEAVREIRDGCFTAMATRLPLEQRVAFALVDIFGVEVAEVAVVLGKSVPAAKAVLHRARENMNAFFGHHCEWVLPENACRCRAWAAFVRDRATVRNRLKELGAEPPDFTDPAYAARSDPDTMSRVLALFRSLPERKPDDAWYTSVIRALRE
ncbi:MAG: RNA polymerase sigma factor [Firmicutes bacterium]|nr:RNA polymerase sigma factor [Bacillota bacterium]